MKKRYILSGLFGVMLCVGAILLSQAGQGGAAPIGQGGPVIFKQISAVNASAVWALGTDGVVYRWSDLRGSKWERIPSPIRQ